MNEKSMVSPDDQGATFVELFFDLVFVFGVTQLVGLLHHEFTWAGAGKTILVFWMVWWAWTQFTWALNAADTTHPLIELGTLLATAIAMKKAMIVATIVPNSTSGCVVSAALSAQVNCVHAHQTIQKTRIALPAPAHVKSWWIR